MNTREAVKVAIAAAIVLIVSSMVGAVSLSTITPYTQSLDSLGTTVPATLPVDFRVDRTTTSNAGDVRKVGTFAAAGTVATLIDGASVATNAQNGIYNFGSGTTDTGPDRSVGFISSGTGTASGNIYAQLTNSTEVVLSGLQIAYAVEKYRNGSNANGFRIQLFASPDGTNWTSAGDAFKTAFTADANNNGFATAPGATVSVSNVLSASIPPGGTIYLAWNYSVTAGTTVTNAQGLAVDDISILGLQSTNPAGVGSATPSTVPAGTATTLAATVQGGSSPPSTGLAVTCNLSAIGGSATTSIPNNAGTFSLSYTVPEGTTGQAYVLPCVVSDEQARSSGFSIPLTVTVPFLCETDVKTSTPIHQIQGAGSTTGMDGQIVELEGIVVGSFRTSQRLSGYFLQEPDATWDLDAATSEGIFIFEGAVAVGPSVAIGDRVRVKGEVNEFTSSGTFLGNSRSSPFTELQNIQNTIVCSSGHTFARTVISLPAPSVTDFERFEGMAVAIEQPLVVTGNVNLGNFGQVDLAPSVLFTPTHSQDRTTWASQAALLPRNVIALDDGSAQANANLFPTLFPSGGLSAANTLRVGSFVNYDPNTQTTTPLIGVLDDRFGTYRLHPTAPVSFHDANPRSDAATVLASAGGRFRGASANVLNFFTTFGSRGAANPSEFDKQKTKIVIELVAMDADVYGLSEVQNFASGGTNGGTYTNAALQSLVDGMNCLKAGASPTCTTPPAGPFGFVDTTTLGAINGTDAIRNAILYRTDRLVLVGGPAIFTLNDTNRPTIAQTFRPLLGAKALQQTFTFVVNHFKSKGSSCGAAFDDPLQGDCNGRRLLMAQGVTGWLATNPTGDPAGVGRRLLVIGDFNAYLGEDPIQHFMTQGFANLVASLLGPNAYSYNFGSQRGYLDHALANGAMNALVRNVAEWHNNSDEPASLQALDSSSKSAAAQVAYFGPDPFAASDHDPIVIGFNTLMGDINDDGSVSVADQQLIIAAIGKKPPAVDRRMDYDGDGTITLNDYRIWTSHYRAFIQ